MHQKLAKDGFLAMAVNLDDPKEQETMIEVEEFYAKQQARFPVFVLNEAQETWMKKFDITGVPAVFVFDREGKLAKKYPLKEDDFEVKYDKIEKLVEELLQKK
jgi:thioredoxin-related protein